MRGDELMETTAAVQTLTDEQLKDLQEYCAMTQHIHSGEQACVSLYELRGLLDELRTLRAENAELRKDAGRYRKIVKFLQPSCDFRGICMPRDYSSATKDQCDDAIDNRLEQAK